MLSGAFIDYIFGIFAKVYRDVKFLPTLFAAHELRRMDARDLSALRVSDVLGMPVNLSLVKQIVLCNNLNDNHWTMIHISVKQRRRELSLFEPMGLPQTRKSKSNAAAARRVSREQRPRAVATGVGTDGHQRLPVMPWPNYMALSDPDLGAIADYLRSLPPVHRPIPAITAPSETIEHPYVRFGIFVFTPFETDEESL